MRMRLIVGRVRQGQVVVDEPLPEGAEVTVAFDADDEPAEVTADEARELEGRIAAVGRGEFVASEDVLASLRIRRQ